MKLHWHQQNLHDLHKLAGEIIKYPQSKKIAMFGNLGAGKTTLIKELVEAIGIQSIVSSPSFTILNEYHADSKTVYHFDFYRIKEAREIYELGYEEYFYSEAYVFIEWPENIAELLPPFFSKLHINIESPETRSIIWED
jgi:tRNA threonylcarbamoyladenosine biosynthesis protein TsaE